MKPIKQLAALKNFSFYIVLLKAQVVARIAVYYGPSKTQIDVEDEVTGLTSNTASELARAWHGLEVHGVKLYDGSVSDFETRRMEERYKRMLARKQNPEFELRARGMHLAGDGSGRVYYIAGLDRLKAKGYTVVRV